MRSGGQPFQGGGSSDVAAVFWYASDKMLRSPSDEWLTVCVTTLAGKGTIGVTPVEPRDQRLIAVKEPAQCPCRI